MAPTYAVFSPREIGNGETRWHRIGAAWPMRNKENAFNLQLDSLPLPDKNGKVTIMVFPVETQAPVDKNTIDDSLPF